VSEREARKPDSHEERESWLAAPGKAVKERLAALTALGYQDSGDDHFQWEDGDRELSDSGFDKLSTAAEVACID
jgi:hypothetical protein